MTQQHSQTAADTPAENKLCKMGCGFFVSDRLYYVGRASLYRVFGETLPFSGQYTSRVIRAGLTIKCDDPFEYNSTHLFDHGVADVSADDCGGTA